MHVVVRKSAKQCRARWALCLLTAAMVTSSHRSLADAEIVALVHPANTVSSISLHEMRLMYALYRGFWPQGMHVRIVLPLPDSPGMDFLLANIYQRPRTAIDVERFYREALFEQRIGSLPVSFGHRETLKFVRANIGALAVFDRSELPTDPLVRVLEIVGSETSAGFEFPGTGPAAQAPENPRERVSGRWIRKIEPPVSGLSTWMFPEWARAISMARGRPSPSDEPGWPLPR